MRTWALASILVCLLMLSSFAQPLPPSVTQVIFPEQEATALRLVILSTQDGVQPCVDELEVFGPGSGANLALASKGAVASASSSLPGYAIHQIENLNDGQYGNDHSWIPNGVGGEWAAITFPALVTINRVILSRDREARFRDRRIASFEIQVRTGEGDWHTIKTEELAIGDPNALPNPPLLVRGRSDKDDLQGAAFLNEEYALLKAHGRADLHPHLSKPRYKMERPGPKHVGDDSLPLPTLHVAPVLDGTLDDTAWEGASRGVVRVASLDSFEKSPLVEHAVYAGVEGEYLYLGIQVDRLISNHIAVVSGADWQGCGAIVRKNDKLFFNAYVRGEMRKSTELDAAVNAEATVVETRLPLKLFPEWQRTGMRVGLGLGGKYTAKQGRPVHFMPAPWSLAAEGCTDGIFNVRITANDAVSLQLNLPDQSTLHLTAGDVKQLRIPAAANAIGPEATLGVSTDNAAYTLHLFDYQPTENVLTQSEAMLERLAAKGLEVTAARKQVAALRKRFNKKGDRRNLLAEARQLKRDLLFRDPDLAQLEKTLFVKRHPFRPSHNYSVILDAPWSPGGAVCVLETPLKNGALQPDQAVVKELFDAGNGLARTPMADFETNTIYFAYRDAPEGYYHLWQMDADGGNAKEITSGPFHDYWPCPLPDGGLAFISTRCKKRFLCWRPQAATLHRMDADGGNMRALSYANLTEWAPSVMDDGRIIWTRSEYQDKAADFGHTLWSIRPDGTHPELVFGNTIIKTQGYANGRYVPGRNEVACTLISHFGDLNGPIALLDVDQGRFNPEAINSITPEVFWPGGPPSEECFRDPVPVSKEYFLCSHASRKRFDLYIIDRFGNRELFYADADISSMCPTIFQPRTRPPNLTNPVGNPGDYGEFIVRDVYQGLEPQVKRGEVAYLAVSEETSHTLDQLASGAYRNDHEPFQHFYASPSDVLTGPFGWPTYVAKGALGTVPVEPDGSAYFKAPSGKVLFFHVLDKEFNELQRMRSVIQLQPGESRSCTGCHEDRKTATEIHRRPMALAKGPQDLTPPPFGAGNFSYERVVQPVLDKNCVSCHDAQHEKGLDFTAKLDQHKIPASYRTMISKGLVHYADWTWSNPDVCKKLPPLSLGTVKSPLWHTLDKGHNGVKLSPAETQALKTWIDLNCPLWPDYIQREHRKPLGELLAQSWLGE